LDHSSAGAGEPEQRDAKTSRPPQRQGYPHADRGGVSVGAADVQKVRSKESADSRCSFYGRRCCSRMGPWSDPVARQFVLYELVWRVGLYATCNYSWVVDHLGSIIQTRDFGYP